MTKVTKRNQAILWCDSCRTKQAHRKCHKCQTIFCFDCFNIHMTIHPKTIGNDGK